MVATLYMARAYLLCISRVATSVTSLAGFCNCTEHVYAPESEGTRLLMSRRLLLAANSSVILVLPSFTIGVPLCLHDTEAILCDGCKLVTVHVAVTNLSATGLVVVKLTCTSARKIV